MNIVYSSSDEYTRHAGVSITSLFEMNKAVEQLNVYVIDYGISQTNKERLNCIADQYGRAIAYIAFDGFKSLIKTDESYNISVNSYARLLLAEILPQDVERVIWLDCDTVVTDSLTALWNIDMQGKAIGAVQDCTRYWEEVGSDEYFRYFCAGVFIADLKKWRSINATEKCLSYIEKKNGRLEHVDQTVLNGVFYKDCVIIHPRYDVLTPTYEIPYKNLIAYLKLEEGYYSRQEIKESLENPAIIHFTSSNSGRPWEEGTRHPKANIYIKYWKESAWKNVGGGDFRSSMDPAFRRAYWMYQHLPLWLIRLYTGLGKLFKNIAA